MTTQDTVTHDGVSFNTLKNTLFQQWCRWEWAASIHLTRAEQQHVGAALKLLNIEMFPIHYDEPRFHTDQARNTISAAQRITRAIAAQQWDTVLGVAYQITPLANPNSTLAFP